MKYIKLFEELENPDKIAKSILDNISDVDEYWFEEGVYESVEDIIREIIYDLDIDIEKYPKLMEYLKRVFSGYQYSRNPAKAADSFIDNEWWNRAVDDDVLIDEIKDCL